VDIVIIDTSAYSAYMRGHAGVNAIVRRNLVLALPPVVLGELDAGFRAGNRLERNRAELREFLSARRVQVPAMTAATADRYAAIHDYLRGKGTPVPTNDIWIAAVAMEHGWLVLTTDAHFKRIPQILVEIPSP
jgi:predicted nucleic acid-binding protein